MQQQLLSCHTDYVARSSLVATGLRYSVLSSQTDPCSMKHQQVPPVLSCAVISQRPETEGVGSFCACLLSTCRPLSARALYAPFPLA